MSDPVLDEAVRLIEERVAEARRDGLTLQTDLTVIALRAALPALALSSDALTRLIAERAFAAGVPVKVETPLEILPPEDEAAG